MFRTTVFQRSFACWFNLAMLLGKLKGNIIPKIKFLNRYLLQVFTSGKQKSLNSKSLNPLKSFQSEAVYYLRVYTPDWMYTNLFMKHYQLSAAPCRDVQDCQDGELLATLSSCWSSNSVWRSGFIRFNESGSISSILAEYQSESWYTDLLNPDPIRIRNTCNKHHQSVIPPLSPFPHICLFPSVPLSSIVYLSPKQCVRIWINWIWTRIQHFSWIPIQIQIRIHWPDWIQSRSKHWSAEERR